MKVQPRHRRAPLTLPLVVLEAAQFSLYGAAGILCWLLGFPVIATLILMDVALNSHWLRQPSV